MVITNLGLLFTSRSKIAQFATLMHKKHSAATSWLIKAVSTVYAMLSEMGLFVLLTET